jgi:acyl-CoA thioester hydrolase
MNKNFFNYRIYFEDTDTGGIVYYANYLKFYERARTDFLRQFNISQQQLANEQKIGFVVRKVMVEYLKSAKLDDEITVSVKFNIESNIIIKAYQEIKIDKKILSIAEVDLICINTEKHSPNRIPENLKYIFNV